MNFKDAPDDPIITGQTHRKISVGGLVSFGVYRVMFGFRVRAGFESKHYCELDWCAGNDWNNVERLYSILLAILVKREEDVNCFKGLPDVSRIKPFFMDQEFTDLIVKEAGELELIKLPMPV